eukprot:gene7888-4073_t
MPTGQSSGVGSGDGPPVEAPLTARAASAGPPAVKAAERPRPPPIKTPGPTGEDLASRALGRESDHRAAPPIWLLAKEAADRGGPPRRSPLKGRAVDKDRVEASCRHLHGMFSPHLRRIEAELGRLLKNYTKLPRAAVDDQELRGWKGATQRVKLFFGKAYTYKNGPVRGVERHGDEELVVEVPDIPDWVWECVIDPLVEAGVYKTRAVVDMVTINVYAPGSFIVGHRDPPETFDVEYPIVTSTF